MEAETRPVQPSWKHSVLAGLQAGVLAGVVLVTWLLLAADWRRQSLWSVANLFGGTFYPELVFRSDFTRATLAGLALPVFLSGCVGAAYGVMVAPIASSRSRGLLALATALSWYYLSFALLWRRFNPALFHYGGREAFFIGHVLFGLVLAAQFYLEQALVAPAAESPQQPDEGRIQ